MEKIEKNKNAQLAREIEIALPVELSAGQNLSLARDYCRKHFVDAGMCADICIHDKNDGNPHAHIMLTMRPFEQDGNWAAKSRKEYILDENGERILLKSGAFKSRKVDATDWNNRGKAEEWRQAWAEMCNAAMEQQGVAERIDHRSYERQGIEQIPTIHLGPAAFQMEKRGIRTERGDINRQIHLDNQMIRQLRARIRKLERTVDDLTAAANPSHPIPSISLMEMVSLLFRDLRLSVNYLQTFPPMLLVTSSDFLQEYPNVSVTPENAAILYRYGWDAMDFTNVDLPKYSKVNVTKETIHNTTLL